MSITLTSIAQIVPLESGHQKHHIKKPEILGGTPVFSGTRVPIETLFDHLEAGVPLDAFLDEFPTVSKEQAVAFLEIAMRSSTTD